MHADRARNDDSAHAISHGPALVLLMRWVRTGRPANDTASLDAAEAPVAVAASHAGIPEAAARWRRS